jgi:hypothetical protein
MKYSFCLLFVAILFLSSCEQCYECQLKDNNGNVDKTENFCGDPQQADEYEAAGYTCSNQ